MKPLVVVVGTENVTFAVAAVFEGGTKTKFFAREKTILRTVAASKKNSFSTKVALKALI